MTRMVRGRSGNRVATGWAYQTISGLIPVRWDAQPPGVAPAWPLVPPGAIPAKKWPIRAPGANRSEQIRLSVGPGHVGAVEPAQDEVLSVDGPVSQVFGQRQQPAEVLCLGPVAVHAPTLLVEEAGHVDAGGDLRVRRSEVELPLAALLDGALDLLHGGGVGRVELISRQRLDRGVEVPRQ